MFESKQNLRLRRCLVLTALALFWCIGQTAAQGKQAFRIGEGQGWSFLNGAWTGGSEGELIPPDGTEVEYTAVVDDREYADFEARFRFKFRAGAGGARLLFRLQDNNRYYALDVPFGGQQSRVRHFWAGMVIADGTTFQRYLNFGLVPGLGAELERWYEGRVEARGPRLRAWIEGRPVADIEDHTYKRGRLGLCGIVSPYVKTPHFANLEVTGSALKASSWTGLKPMPPYWITPNPETDPKTYQSYPNMLLGKNGKLLATITFGNPNAGEVRRTVYVRSTDAGRTWSKAEQATLEKGLGANFAKADGTWVCVFNKPEGDPAKALYSYESSDEGKSWDGPISLKIEGEWPKEFKKPGGPIGPVRLRDQSLVLPLIAKIEDGTFFQPTVYNAYVLRSTDDGRTWSAPVRCDADNLRRPEGTQWMSASNFYELGLAEVEDSVLLGIGRPGMDPYMWQIQSDDGGRTWRPAAIGPFPGYCPSLTRTAGGMLVATTRFPYFTAHVSRDRGRSWDPPVILDYATWANQKAVEVEPDVVLVNYMGHIMKRGQADNRMLRLQVTKTSLQVSR